MRTLIPLVLSLGLLAIAAPAQTVYVMDGATSTALQQESGPGAGACSAPNPLGSPGFSFAAAPPCGGTPPTLGTAVAPLGDIAVDGPTDTVLVTDGFLIGEFRGDPPCPSAPGTPKNTYVVPPIPNSAATGIMAGLTGMGMDSAGGILWVTDGADIAGLSGVLLAGGSCIPPAVAVPAFASGLPGAPFLTDVTWDPASGSLWVCDTTGTVSNVAVGGGLGAGGSFVAAGACGLTSGLTGIAYDLATPGATTAYPALFVTDGTALAFFDASTGTVPATGPLYTGGTCGASMLPGTNGLAYAAGGVTYGTSRVAMTIGTHGQSTSPGMFGLEVTGNPGGLVWLVANFLPGLGPTCRPISGATTNIWVSPFGPAIITPLAAFPASCSPFPATIPAGIVPPGITIVVQLASIDTTSPVGNAFDATEGVAFTITAP